MESGTPSRDTAWAMSEENVEVVRRYLEKGLESVSPEQLPAWVAGFWESDGDYYPVRGFPEARPCHGREEIADFFVGLRDPWNYQAAVKDARAIGDDRVLVHTHVRAEGGTSGAAVEGDVYSCFWLRHGRFIRVEDHLTAKGALHAIGLSGETLEAAGLRE
jgi:SnoaL-like domain